ncbi:hypothetical protein [Ferruginibacter sp. HRS2-29]|uniref:hypothetical protein n=1 Tax=Ferruginibacter sp. HRS2-29 TaxID=2487334 RepID=UPI0020CE1E67|nr:hypothetical protein [Ferruginibacter sp. HRS2-29]
MDYQLDSIVQMLRTSLSPSEISKTDDPEKYVTTNAQEIQTLLDNQLDELKKQITSPPIDECYKGPVVYADKAMLLEFIPRLQRDTIAALNELYAITHSAEYENLPTPLIDFYKGITEKLSAFLDRLLTDFARFKNMQYNIPHFHREELKIKLRPDYDAFVSIMNEEPMALMLKLKLLSNFYIFINPGDELSYEKLKMMELFISKAVPAYELLHRTKEGITSILPEIGKDIYSEWLDLYYIESLALEAERLDTTAAQIIYYHRRLTTLKQLLADDTKYQSEEWQQSMNRIIRWIELEIPLAEKKHLYTPVQPPLQTAAVAAPPLSQTGMDGLPTSMNTTLTVHEWSMLLDAAVNTGLVKDSFWAGAVKLKEWAKSQSGKELDPKSLQAKKNMYDQGVRRRLIDKVKKVLEELQEGL